jgi:type II secretory pathway pseudopilin PulG
MILRGQPVSRFPSADRPAIHRDVRFAPVDSERRKSRNAVTDVAARQSGYAMAVLLISMSVMAIMITVAMPTWKQMSRREKEAELVFRGEQYARAIQLFQAKAGPGTLPPSVDLLVDQRFLRRKFKDPIANDDFAPIVQLPGAAAGAAGGRGPAQPGAPQPQPAVARGSAPAGAAVGATPGGTPTGGIIGFTSKSKEQSIRLYKGRNHYNEWQFMPAARVGAPGAGNPGAPGQRGGNQAGQRGGIGAQGPTAPQPAGSGPQTAPPRGIGPGSPNGPFAPFPMPAGRTGR